MSEAYINRYIDLDLFHVLLSVLALAPAVAYQLFSNFNSSLNMYITYSLKKKKLFVMPH